MDSTFYVVATDRVGKQSYWLEDLWHRSWTDIAMASKYESRDEAQFALSRAIEFSSNLSLTIEIQEF